MENAGQKMRVAQSTKAAIIGWGLTHDARQSELIRDNMLVMSVEGNSTTPLATREAELVREMRERLLRCAALSAFCLTLRDQVRKKMPEPHGSGRSR